MLDLDSALSTLRTSTHLPESSTLTLCTYVRSLLLEESTAIPVQTPVTICGDVHGQFWDVLHLLRLCDGEGREGVGRYVFMGDFVDRGYYSLETVTLLFLLKTRYPQNITLLRGNHESRQITQVYGFYDECQTKFGNSAVWKAFCGCFDYLGLAAIIDDQILCVHGGLSPDVKTIDQIRVLARVQEIPHEGAFCDLMWSDPEEIDGWAVSPRGAGWLFGARVTREFLHLNDLSLLARAHQLVQEGYKHMFSSPLAGSSSFSSSLGSSLDTSGIGVGGRGEEGLVTVWSAPNYCYRCGNLGSVMRLGYDSSPAGVKTLEELESEGGYSGAGGSSSSPGSGSGSESSSPRFSRFSGFDDEDPSDSSHSQGGSIRGGGGKSSPSPPATGVGVSTGENKPAHFLAPSGTVGPTGIRKDFIVFDAAPENALDREQRVGRAGVMTMQYFV